MHKYFLILILLAGEFVAFAQENWGKIIFYNNRIPTADGTRTYSVPLYDVAGGSPAGNHPDGAKVGLFLPGREEPLAIASLRTGEFAAYFASSQIVSVVGVPPGAVTNFVVRAWQGPSWEDARWNGLLRNEWMFKSKPLGGTPIGGGAEIPNPGMTGWGHEDSSILSLGPLSLIPWTGIRYPATGSVFAAPATIHITGSAIRYHGYWGQSYYVITNFAVFAGSSLVSTQIPASEVFTVTTPPLGAGTYVLSSAMNGHFLHYDGLPPWPAGEAPSYPVTVNVVDPVEVSLGQPTIGNDKLSFEYSVNPGLRYIIQSSTDLHSWQTLQTNIPTSSPGTFSQSFSGNSAIYYRVERLPNL